MNISPDNQLIWPLLLYGLAVILLVIIMIGLSYLLGQRHSEKVTGEQFESGMVITGTARVRFSAHFYLVAMFFVIFDLEAAFLIAWSVAFNELGWEGYTAAAVFIFILIVVLIYEWRIGALDFGISGKKILMARKKYKMDSNAI